MGFEFIDGGQAICRGALHAGADFFAGYPITPATGILIEMMRELPRRGGIAIQGEDEIASISMCLGAALAGRKVFTATSGPGMSLYSETIGFALITEAPMVIVDVQRLGPSTGGATTGAQGDVQFARWITAGGLPMVVLCPGSIESLFTLTVKAFNLAETLRTPVILLTQKDFVLSTLTVDLDRLRLPEPVNRKRFEGGGPYLPYAFETPGDVPPFAPIGGEALVRYTGSMHDAAGYLTKNPAEIAAKFRHLEAKILRNAALIETVTLDLEQGAADLVVGIGASAPCCREAVARLRAEGRPCSLAVVESLYPEPAAALQRAFAAGARRLVVPEMNLGLYAHSLQALVPPGVEVLPLPRVDGELITVADIQEGLR